MPRCVWSEGYWLIWWYPQCRQSEAFFHQPSRLFTCHPKELRILAPVHQSNWKNGVFCRHGKVETFILIQECFEENRTSWWCGRNTGGIVAELQQNFLVGRFVWTQESSGKITRSIFLIYRPLSSRFCRCYTWHTTKSRIGQKSKSWLHFHLYGKYSTQFILFLPCYLYSYVAEFLVHVNTWLLTDWGVCRCSEVLFIGNPIYNQATDDPKLMVLKRVPQVCNVFLLATLELVQTNFSRFYS